MIYMQLQHVDSCIFVAIYYNVDSRYQWIQSRQRTVQDFSDCSDHDDACCIPPHCLATLARREKEKERVKNRQTDGQRLAPVIANTFSSKGAVRFPIENIGYYSSTNTLERKTWGFKSISIAGLPAFLRRIRPISLCKPMAAVPKSIFGFATSSSSSDVSSSEK